MPDDIKNILITGGSGLIGHHLSALLSTHGYNIRILSTNPQKIKKYPAFKWNIEKKYIDPLALEDIDVIIHLAGANISEARWTKKRKQQIIISRVNASELLYEYVHKYHIPIKQFISASAIGYYGTYTSEKIFTENDPPGHDFLANVGALWEDAAWEFNNLNANVAIVRTGVVLAWDGGIIKRLYPLARLGLLSPLGSGKQYFPWIHINDLCNIYLWILENQINDVFNGVAPQFITFKDFVKTFMKILNKKIIMPSVPSFILKIVLGEMSSILLHGSRVSAEKLLKAGFKFSFPAIDQALIDILNQHPEEA